MFKKLPIITLLITLLLPVGSGVTQGQDMEPPQFEPVEDCFVALPLGSGLRERTECGYVTVPENRDDPNNDRMIRLAVVVIHPRSKAPLPDPVMYLDGGPGGSVMNWLIPGAYYMYVQPILQTGRSVILFTQRGVYPAEPAIEPAPQCDSIYAVQRDVLNETNAATLDAYLATWSDCLNDLAEVVDLSAYHATAMAADANDIRGALGFEQVNLWGQSYGTRVALTILRDYPDSVRAAILDSPLPLDADLGPDSLIHKAAALDRLFADCASNAECRAIAPDLRALFFETATALNTEPIVITRDLMGSNEMVPYVIDGRRFTLLMPSGNSQLLRYIPKLIVEANEGRFVEAIQAVWGPQWHYNYSIPLVHIASCNEEAPFYAVDAIHAAAETTPDYASLFYADWHALDLCALGNFRTPPPIENEPVSSDVPVLLLAGEFDHVTPPAYAEQAAATLDNAFVYTIPYAGHATVYIGRCFYDIIQDFLNDLTTAPDTSCLVRREQQFRWATTLPSGQP